ASSLLRSGLIARIPAGAGEAVRRPGARAHDLRLGHLLVEGLHPRAKSRDSVALDEVCASHGLRRARERARGARTREPGEASVDAAGEILGETPALHQRAHVGGSSGVTLALLEGLAVALGPAVELGG